MAEPVQAGPDGQINPTPTDGGLPAEWASKSPQEIYKAYQEAQSSVDAYKAAAEGRSVDDVKQVWDWSKQVAAAIKEGRLKDASALQERGPTTEHKATPTEGDGPFSFPDNYDELTPREQAYLLTSQIQKANQAHLAKLVQEEAAKYGSQIQQWTGQQEAEKALLFKIIDAGRSNPKLDMQAALQEAARLKSSSPEQLLDMAIKQLGQPSNESVINEQVSKLVAQKLQEAENARLESAFGGAGGARRKVKLNSKPKTHDDVNRGLMREWAKAGLA